MSADRKLTHNEWEQSETQPVSTPEWLKPGAFVKVQHWYGMVEDVAVSPTRIMVLIKSPKSIWRNQRDASEWLEYIEGQIVPADREAVEQDIEAHAERIQHMMAELDAFRGLVNHHV